jgi:ABC-type multidrug transport system fused ATPase/permease subunit
MIAIYRKIFDLLDPQERRRFWQLLGLIMLMGLLDMAGVASILPFLAVVSDPAVITENPQLAMLYGWSGLANPDSFLILFGGLVFGFVIFSLGFKTLTLYAIARFSQMRNHSISTRLLASYLSQPYVWFLNHHSADLGKSVLAEVQSLVGGVLIPAMRLLAQTVSLGFLVILLILVNPGVALTAAIGLGGAYVLIFLAVRRYLGRIGKIRLEANKARFQIAQEVMGGIKEVKLMGLETAYLTRFRAPSRAMATSTANAQITGELPRHLLEGIAFGGMIALIISLLLKEGGNLADILPVLGVFAFAALRMFPAVQQIYHSLTLMRSNGMVLTQIHRDIMAMQVASAGPSAPALHLRQTLDLVDVHYAYPQTETSALKGLSLSIRANTTVGIVGGTGAGKTTAVDVMLGLLAPQAGELRVDGVVITPENLRAWQNSVGYVAQQIFLIDDSVAANIAFGIAAEAIDMAAVERAARVANLHDFVMGELPQGYQTAVGERGVRLSGGQRQRIGIARALYHDPDVLLLDEATSALDNLTERAVMEAVHNLGHDKTIIMIAHRLTTVRDCDMIFLLENGQLAAQGRYEDLVRDNEIFRRMASV